MLANAQQRGARRSREWSLLVQGIIATTIIVAQLVLFAISLNKGGKCAIESLLLEIVPLLVVHTSNASVCVTILQM